MSRKIRIRAGEVEMEARLNQSATAGKVYDGLPIRGRANRWGDEIYFEIPVRHGLEPGSREVLEAGELGYWPTGRAFCIFFGPTPASRGDEIRAASAVNPLGRVTGDPARFRAVSEGAEVILERHPEAP